MLCRILIGVWIVGVCSIYGQFDRAYGFECMPTAHYISQCTFKRWSKPHRQQAMVTVLDVMSRYSKEELLDYTQDGDRLRWVLYSFLRTQGCGTVKRMTLSALLRSVRLYLQRQEVRSAL